MVVNALLTTLFVMSGVSILFLASNVLGLWIVWFICLGIFIGALTQSIFYKIPIFIISLCSILIISVVCIRALPIHSLSWGGADSLTIESLGNNLKIEIKDPKALKELREFGQKGRYCTAFKTFPRYHIYLHWGNVALGYFVHYDSVGFGSGETLFVPEKKGLLAWMDDLVGKQSGDKAKSGKASATDLLAP
jgi:energy-coupling factor transporter transmembrane protein EcfT